MIQKKIFSFLKELNQNNNREWFQNKKDLFNEIQIELIVIAGTLLSEIEKFDKSLKGINPKDCIFRIYKDVRFSKDKSPYKTNLGIFMKSGGRKTIGAGYYLHIEPSKSMLGCGIYEPDSITLNKIRNSLSLNAKNIKKIILSPSFIKEFGTEFHGEKLKSAPKGFAKDHPEIELLKYKSFAAIKVLKDSELLSKTFLQSCINSYKIAFPLNAYLNHIIL